MGEAYVREKGTRLDEKDPSMFLRNITQMSSSPTLAPDRHDYPGGRDKCIRLFLGFVYWDIESLDLICVLVSGLGTRGRRVKDPMWCVFVVPPRRTGSLPTTEPTHSLQTCLSLDRPGRPTRGRFATRKRPVRGSPKVPGTLPSGSVMTKKKPL